MDNSVMFRSCADLCQEFKHDNMKTRVDCESNLRGFKWNFTLETLIIFEDLLKVKASWKCTWNLNI